MSKRKRYRQTQQEVFDAKIFYAKVLKRYGIMLAITVPIILAVNFLLSYLMPDSYQGAVVYVVIFVILLLALFLTIVISNHLDKKEDEKPIDRNKERDPFAD